MLELTLGRRADGQAITTAGRENPHIFVDGISGAGKSFKLKRLAEDAVCQRAQVIAFDYTGDFAAYMPPEGLPLRRMDVSSEELQINPLSPASGAPASVRGQRLVNLLLAGYRLGTRACVDLMDAAVQYLESGPEIPTVSGLVEYIEQVCPMTRGLASALEPLKGLSHLITSGPEEINVKLNLPGLLILEFRQVESAWMRQLMIELLLRVIWDSRTSTAAGNPNPLILLLDECQNLNWRKDGMPVRILREGRKFEIGGWFASQWVENECAKAALREAAVQMHFRQDQDAATKLARTLASNNREKRERYTRLIRSLPRGSFIVENPCCGICLGHM